LEWFKEEIKGKLEDLKDDVREEVAYLLGMESYVYGYPLVMMDVTREVLTAAPAPNAEGTAAPINQFAKMPHYVDPNQDAGRHPQDEEREWLDQSAQPGPLRHRL
jgi:hypothetical protein